MKIKGVTASPVPRSAIISMVCSRIAGMAKKVTRRKSRASGAISGPVPSSASTCGARNQPATEMRMASGAKVPTAVPTTSRAAAMSRRPTACPIRMVEAMPKPKTKAVSRNMIRLPFVVAASAFSPRRRPTQTASIEPLADCSTDDPSVGSAKASSVA